MAKKSVFISYAHKDGLEFTRRLAFALDFYLDVFWDKRLKAGDYPSQLKNEIEERDFLLLVMTPFSIESDWCKLELAHAETHNKGIVLARIYSGEGTTAPHLTNRYTYGDFTEDFEVGFRSVVAQMLGTPQASWERYTELPDPQLLEILHGGYLPTLIAQELAEWAIIDRLWIVPSTYAEKVDLIFRAAPRTPTGALRMSTVLTQNFAKLRDSLGARLSGDVRDLVEPIVRELWTLRDSDHERAGQLSHQLMLDVKSILNKHAVGFRDAKEAWIVQHFFDFDVAEKIRELINQHARRSRYLY